MVHKWFAVNFVEMKEQWAENRKNKIGYDVVSEMELEQ